VSESRRILVIADHDSPAALTVSAIRRDVAQHPGWHLRVQLGVPSPAILPALTAWRPDGILHLIGSVTEHFTDVPTITLRGNSGRFQVRFDEESIGALAADTLLHLGHRTLAVLHSSGPSDDGWHAVRNRGFIKRAREHAVEPVVIPLYESHTGDHRQSFMRSVQALKQRPCAVFTGNDVFATYLLEACEELAVLVPEELAILGADDLPEMDEQRIPLSSVRLPHGALGQVGLQQLAILWAGGTPTDQRLQPTGVSLRSSTERLLNVDPAIVMARKFIHAHTDRAIGLDEVAAAAGMSRSSLAVRFRIVLRRTIKQEIDRARVARAIVLLTSRKMSVTAVALAIGCSDSSHFTRLFRRVTGHRPFGYRASDRAAHDPFASAELAESFSSKRPA
jgi:LacI family transcriptional regulator